MHTDILKVCGLDVFDSNFQNFWVGDLSFIKKIESNFIMPHTNDFYMFLFVDSAVGTIQIDSYSSSFGSSKIFIIEPGCIHSIQLDAFPLGKVICFSEALFQITDATNIVDESGFFENSPKAKVDLSERTHIKLSCILSLIQDEYANNELAGETVLKSYMSIFLLELRRLNAISNSGKGLNQKRMKIREFKKLVAIYCESTKLPSAYADRMNVSANYLNKICKEETGFTAGKIIRNHILIESQRKLRFSNFTIYQIAEQLGFGSTSYFISFFKKEAKITPEQFRKDSQG